MTLRQALGIAARRGLYRDVLASYRQVKPWWAFWVSEHEAAELALAEWDLIDGDL